MRGRRRAAGAGGAARGTGEEGGGRTMSPLTKASRRCRGVASVVRFGGGSRRRFATTNARCRFPGARFASLARSGRPGWALWCVVGAFGRRRARAACVVCRRTARRVRARGCVFVARPTKNDSARARRPEHDPRHRGATAQEVKAPAWRRPSGVARPAPRTRLMVQINAPKYGGGARRGLAGTSSATPWTQLLEQHDASMGNRL